MGIPFLGEIEKLINEHGSSKILQERIALANDQYAALEKELSASKTREAQFETENLRLKLDNEQLKTQVRELHDQIHEINLLTVKYGVYWDKDGNVYCPKCKTPGLKVAWATYVRQQVHGLKCTCSDSPFILMENGEPIHAQEAMKLMAQQR
ncbi:MAG: hypothetical protein C4522_10400 [Desulfobacteraceae bacterium]|nr:MAG: hypothetical protein C4522_10400 [Desulfobacteraceae bacterium]